MSNEEIREIEKLQEKCRQNSGVWDGWTILELEARKLRIIRANQPRVTSEEARAQAERVERASRVQPEGRAQH